MGNCHPTRVLAIEAAEDRALKAEARAEAAEAKIEELSAKVRVLANQLKTQMDFIHKHAQQALASSNTIK